MKYQFLILICFIGKYCFLQVSDENGLVNFYHKNGAISSKGRIEKGKPEGSWINYYSTGILKSEGNFKKGLTDSIWTYYDSNGNRSKTISYLQNKKQGYLQSYDSLNCLKQLFTYKHDTLHGVYRLYNNSVLIETGYYVNGMKSDEVNYYDSINGRIIKTQTFHQGELISSQQLNRFNILGEREGLWKEFDTHGELLYQVEYKKGKKIGREFRKNEKGKIIITFYDKKGELISNQVNTNVIPVEEYYKNGRLKLEGLKVNNLKQGIYSFYDSLGVYLNSIEYKNDSVLGIGFISQTTYEKDSTWKYYSTNGSVESTGNYSKSTKNGEWIYYFEDGKIQQQGFYKNGIPINNWTWYYQSGIERRKENFYKGLLEGEYFEFDTIGNIMLKGSYYRGEKEGEWTYVNGDIKKIGTYNNNFQVGDWIYIYDNGKPALKGKFQDDVPIGKHKTYYANGKRKTIGKYKSGVKHGKWRNYLESGELRERYIYDNGNIISVNSEKLKY